MASSGSCWDEDVWQEESKPFIENNSYTNSEPYTNKKYERSRRNKQFSNEGLNGSGFGSYRDFNNSSKLSINRSDVGKIIGRGGSKIREFQENSGARIRVADDEFNTDLAVVTITGSNTAQQRAKEVIEAFVSDLNEKSNSFVARNHNNKAFERSTGVDDTAFQSIDWDALKISSEVARQKKLSALPPIKKDFYYEDPNVAACSVAEVERFRFDCNNITVKKLCTDDPRSIPFPVRTFEQAFKMYPDILREVRKQGFMSPSPIQCQAWPILLKGYDMIGIAQTGTGKTIAFLLPALIHIDNQVTPRSERSGPSCLILAPTRELAQQIETETKKYHYRGIKCVCVYGGGSRRDQINVVTKGVEIVIATPGRLNDLIMNNIIDVSSVTYLVLDEADRMLDMGFEPQIRKILLDIRPDRQTVMTSATWPEGVKRLVDMYMDKPFQVNVGTLDLAAVHSVQQIVKFVEEQDKRDILYEFIENMSPDDKAIVFVEKKCIADDLSSDLALSGIECQALHGDREQCDREQALDDLKTGRVRILIATDVASRGLDVKDVTHVINMNVPKNLEDYVHRVGRTGRAGRTGIAITLITRENWGLSEKLIKILEEANQDVPDELYSMAERYRKWKAKKDAEDFAAGGRRFRSFHGRNTY